MFNILDVIVVCFCYFLSFCINLVFFIGFIIRIRKLRFIIEVRGFGIYFYINRVKFFKIIGFDDFFDI